MLVRPAEESYQKGLAALAQGRRLEALALFEAAMALDKAYGAKAPQPRYVSFYGLCLALEARRMSEAAALCREALGAEFYNADLHWNLGRVLLAAGRRREAHDVLVQGLGWERGHSGIVRELRSMGRRRRPVIPFLARRNPINVLLGRMTYSNARPSPARRREVRPGVARS